MVKQSNAPIKLPGCDRGQALDECIAHVGMVVVADVAVLSVPARSERERSFANPHPTILQKPASKKVLTTSS